MTNHHGDLSVESKGPQCLVRAGSGGSDMARRFTLVTSPERTVTFIPAPTLVVCRLTDGSEMARFPATSHRLAREVARRWRFRVEVVTAEPRPIPSSRAECRGGTL